MGVESEGCDQEVAKLLEICKAECGVPPLTNKSINHDLYYLCG